MKEKPPEIPGYEIVRPLASGSSATVYLAVQAGLARQVAVKVLSVGLFDAAETRARFLREAKLQASLSHPHLLALYDAGFAGEQPYLVTGLLPGGSLADRLRGGRPLTIAEAARFGAEIASGLAFAHKAGITHRDLKPANVLLTAELSAKIADFGLAKSAGGGKTLQTRSGVMLGTPGYLAPEVLQGEVAQAPADLYALGVLLHVMLSGRTPFPVDDMSALFKRQLAGPAPELDSVPQPLAALVARCLERYPALRPPSAEAVAEELAVIQAEAPAGVVAPPKARSTATIRVTTSSVQARGPDTSRIDSTSVGRPARRAGPIVLAALLGLAAALALRPRPAPPAPPPLPPPTKPAEPALPPRRLSVSFGVDRAIVSFDRPTVSDSRIVFNSAENLSTSSVDVPPKSTRIIVRGLKQQTNYEVVCSSAEGKLTTRATTLYSHRQTLWLDTGSTSEIAAACLGSRAIAVWPRQLQDSGTKIVYFSESRDGGQSWTAPRALGPETNGVATPAIVATKAGMYAAWSQSVEVPRPRHSVELCFFPNEGEPVGAEIDQPIQVTPPALATEGDRVHLFWENLVKETRLVTLLEHVFEAGELPSRPRQVFRRHPLEENEFLRGRVATFFLDGQLLTLMQRRDDAGRWSLQACLSSLAPPPALVPMTPAPPDFCCGLTREPDSVRFHDQVLLGYNTDTEFRVALVGKERDKWRIAFKAPLREGVESKSPVVGADDRYAYFGYMHVKGSFLQMPNFQLLRSADGLTWESATPCPTGVNLGSTRYRLLSIQGRLLLFTSDSLGGLSILPLDVAFPAR